MPGYYARTLCQDNMLGLMLGYHARRVFKVAGEPPDWAAPTPKKQVRTSMESLHEVLAWSPSMSPSYYSLYSYSRY